jgi:acetyl esterase/lipase
MSGLRWPSHLSVAVWVGVIAAVGLTGIVVLIAKAGQTPSNVVLQKDVVYRTVDGKTLKMDIAGPKAGEGPFPAVLCIHGGGWRAGDKGEYTQALYGLSQQGYVAATVQYRLAPQSAFPAQIHDVKAAVCYLRSHAKELRIDPDRIGVMGGSAGGHLALLLATTDGADGLEPPDNVKAPVSSKVRAVVSLAGPTDLTKPYPKASEYMVTGLIGKSRNEAPELYDKASPLKYVSKGDSPIFAVHGTKDELVPYDLLPEFEGACKKAGVPMELLTIPDGGHGSGGKPEAWAGAITKSVEFFNRHLKPR